MLKNEQTEISEVERWQFWVQRPYEVFVEPLRFFDLKAYSLNGLQFFFGEIDDESYAQVIQP